MQPLAKPRAILTVAALALALAASLAFAAVDGPLAQYAYDQPGDKKFICNTGILERESPTASNNQSFRIASPRAQLKATFTDKPIPIEAAHNAVWDAATAYPISHKFDANMNADSPNATAAGTIRLLWNGPMLYALVEVTGDSTPSDSATPNWNAASYRPTTDGLVVSMDVFNDQWGIETDTQGIFFMGANPTLDSVTSYVNRGIPSLGSFFNPDNQDYCPRLAAFKSSGYKPGSPVNYTYEFALQIEGWGDEWNRELKNGTRIGLDVGIVDQGNSFTYLSRSLAYGGREAGSNLPNSERIRNRDWGVVTLDGWDGKTPFAYSGWRADEDIRFWNSKSNPGGSGNGGTAGDSGDASTVWTPQSKARMIAAKTAFLATKVENKSAFTRAQKDAAVTEVCQAFTALRWADTKYPDPHDLPIQNTIPNVWQFFDKSKGTNGMVTSAQQWADRKKEILDLAQFYEYGYKPKLNIDYTISVTQNNYDGTGNPSVTATITPTNAHFSGGTPLSGTIPVTLPANLPSGQEAAIYFGGNAPGMATVSFPTWENDNRTDAGAWGTPNRTGPYYQLFPYARNSTSTDSSILIANATAVSIYLDILEAACDKNPALAAKIDPTKAATKGFSIGGKNAFVAGIFDDRVKVIVCGGAGATGPANWRYNVQGESYDFTDTPFFSPGAQAIIAHGTEGPGNSYRHNRVRETELFRHFMPYGHMYKHEDGSYAYADYARLPYDQASLVATLAPDRAIIIDTNFNDYNDGAMTDNMSLEIAKGVFKTLGANGDNFIKFNSGNYVSNGDPHGSAGTQPEAQFLADYFTGSHTLAGAIADRLNTDAYSLKVANQRTESPYDYYWGGLNTITGGKTGPAGTDGWFNYKF